MSVNKFSSQFSLSLGSSHTNDTLMNKEHSDTAISLTSAGDIEWQWTSPTGTVSNVKIKADKTPLQQMKKTCKSISPVSNNFPRKRKLIKNEESETKFGSLTHPESFHYIPEPMCDPVIRTEPAVNSKCDTGLQCYQQDYCTLLDEGEDAMDDCLIQCSQYIEESLSQNPKGIIPLDISTPRRSTRVQSALPKTSLNPSVAVKQCLENNHPPATTRVGVSTKCSSLPLSTSGQGTSNNSSYGGGCRTQSLDTNVTPNETVQEAPNTACEYTTKYEINDSFDDILVTFCEENVELLSQPTNERHVPNKNSPLDMLNLQSSSKTAVTQASESISTTFTLPVATQVSVKSFKGIPLPISKPEQMYCDKTALDDDFLEPDLLKLLESVEGNSQPRPASPILHCTPEEIERKRRKAKIKLLQRKQTALKSGLVRT